MQLVDGVRIIALVDEFARFVDHRLDLVALRQQVLYLVQGFYAYRFSPRAWPQYPLVILLVAVVDCKSSPRAGREKPESYAGVTTRERRRAVVSLPSLEA